VTVTTTAPTITGVSVSPTWVSLAPGATLAFTATVTGTGSFNPAVTWSASGGAITAGGAYTAPATVGTYTITATSVQDATQSSNATVSVSAITSVSINPVSASLSSGGTQTFAATVTGTGSFSQAVTWSATGGSIIAGAYTAPTTAGTYTITTTSAQDSTRSASATVTVTSDPVISSFTSNRMYPNPGQSATLIWYTANATTVTLQENDGAPYAVAGSGSKVMRPVTKTFYTLAATGSNGKTVTRTLAVTVLGVMAWKRDIVYLGGKEVGEIDGYGTHTTLTDHLGSPRILVNPDGSTIEQKFAPFGESLTSSTDAKAFAKGFTNHEQTDASGMIYMQARFYAPMYHKFLSPDPGLDQHFEATQSWNIYSYVANNPVLMIDPDGKLKKEGGKYLAYRSLPGQSEPTQPNRIVSYPVNGPDKPGKKFYGQLFSLHTDDGKGIVVAFKNMDKDPGMNFNCHGLTFTEGQYTIHNDQVQTILSHEYTISTENMPSRAGDIAIYRDSNGNVVHSATVSQVDEKGVATAVVQNGGIAPTVAEVSPANGFDSGKYAKIEYYKKKNDSRTDEQKKKYVQELKEKTK